MNRTGTTDIQPMTPARCKILAGAARRIRVREAAAAITRAEELTAEWRTALADNEARGTERSSRIEQAAYDKLVDHIEAKGLNCTKYDPR